MRVLQKSTYKRFIRNDPCVFCGEFKGFTLEHIHPKSRGGKDHWMNLAPACPECNADKSSRSLLEMLLRRQGRVLRNKHGHQFSLRAKQNQQVLLDLSRMPDRWFDPLGLLLGEYLVKRS